MQSCVDEATCADVSKAASAISGAQKKKSSQVVPQKKKSSQVVQNTASCNHPRPSTNGRCSGGPALVAVLAAWEYPLQQRKEERMRSAAATAPRHGLGSWRRDERPQLLCCRCHHRHNIADLVLTAWCREFGQSRILPCRDHVWEKGDLP
eukprot:221478-Pyramimonas_sp.AAC.1